jgi:hypothetical protein
MTFNAHKFYEFFIFSKFGRTFLRLPKLIMLASGAARSHIEGAARVQVGL